VTFGQRGRSVSVTQRPAPRSSVLGPGRRSRGARRGRRDRNGRAGRQHHTRHRDRRGQPGRAPYQPTRSPTPGTTTVAAIGAAVIRCSRREPPAAPTSSPRWSNPWSSPAAPPRGSPFPRTERGRCTPNLILVVVDVGRPGSGLQSVCLRKKVLHRGGSAGRQVQQMVQFVFVGAASRNVVGGEQILFRRVGDRPRWAHCAGVATFAAHGGV